MDPAVALNEVVGAGDPIVELPTVGTLGSADGRGPDGADGNPVGSADSTEVETETETEVEFEVV